MSGAARRVRWRDRAVYWLGRAVFAVAARVPEAIAYPAAAGLGRLFFRCHARRRRVALRMLRNAFPGRSERELLRLGRIATGNVFKVPVDVARLTRLLARGGDLGAVIDLAPGRALLPKPPFLALTAHLGSWEMAAIAMAHLVGEAHGVAKVFKNPLLQRWILANRERCGLHIHPRRGGIRGLQAALARGAVGLQVVDQHQRLRGLPVPFFGELASCERAAATLALRHGYPLIVGFAVRVGGGFRFQLIGSQAFVPATTGDRRADLLATVLRINRELEAGIRAYPEQYLWLHDRYRVPAAAAAAAVAGEDADGLDDDPDGAGPLPDAPPAAPSAGH